MDQKPNKRVTGSVYEDMAFEFLTLKGYRFVARNVYTRFGEVDGIFKDGSVLVFVEVKFRKDTEHGDPLEFIDYKKRRRISRASAFYLKSNGYPLTTPCRFDCVGITGDGTIRHIVNAFDYT